MTLEEAIGSLKIYEEKLQDWKSRREEKLPLSKAVEKPNKYDEGGSHWK